MILLEPPRPGCCNAIPKRQQRTGDLVVMDKDSLTKNRFLKKAEIPLEVVILLLVGMTLLITGSLLFPIGSGHLDYYENGLYGLMLVMFAMQIVTMGKTPFGDVRRSVPLLATGIAVAVVGISTCFIPELYSWLPRILLFIFLGPGGLLLLLQMLIARDKARQWKKLGGIFNQLIVACSLVYVLSVFIAVLILAKQLLTAELTAVVILVYGAAFFYLAGLLWKIYGQYPEAERKPEGTFEITTDQAFILITGVFMLVLGALLVPVNLSLLPFSGSAQLGLLMVLFAIQMLARGSTPLGAFPRSWLMIVAGMLFAGLGIVSCIIPEILVGLLTVLVGVLNILGGIINLAKIAIPMIVKSGQEREPQPRIVARLTAAQITMNVLTILFGTSMLFSGLIPGLVLGVVLAANGCVLLYMLSILTTLDRLDTEEVADVPVP
jgi:hypothetical protein